MFDFVEEALDEIALTIEHEITITLQLAVGLWRDHWNDCPPIERVDQRIGVVSLVADEGARISSLEQRLRAGEIMGRVPSWRPSITMEAVLAAWLPLTRPIRVDLVRHL